MATFKVGQRVASTCASRCGTVPINAPGTVMDVSPGYAWAYGVWFDGYPPPTSRLWGCDASDLKPLVDPKVDAFIEQIKRLKPYEEPKVVPMRINHTLTP